MRRDSAHVARRSTGSMGIKWKARSVVSKGLGGSGRGAYFCPCSSAEKGVRSDLPSKVDSGPRPEEQPPTKRMDGGSNPSRGTTLNSPVRSVNYRRGLTPGLRQRLGLTTHDHFDACARRKQHRNDLPFVQGGSGESRTRTERCPAVEMPAMRQAVLWTASEAFRC